MLQAGWRTDQGVDQVDVGVFDADIIDQARRVKPCGNGYAMKKPTLEVGLGNYVSKFILWLGVQAMVTN